ncbi:N-acetylglucosamine kinase [Streptomyces silvisoli]|uniref:BadF/BadG/BcrA/BcrD ATPase family protein n=1 Tax=Streptomyces silvisoli TaxID=3034235 RepID=A0ABT5ZL76_9ACTN|nr:BadF/BadG/BcrA/BcrD ATPase family protein [Streptomyces silvisoli]MDF3290335.1 BadF/BadG/BcrA/BcrD ATPase family protein [Streptomyces silvisoli]
MTARRRPSAADHWLLGVDSGGSGVRFALARVADDGQPCPPEFAHRTKEPVRTGPDGIDAGHLLAQVAPVLRDFAGRGEVVAACVGAAGMASLGADLRDRLPGALRAEFGVPRLALAADAVTAYAGALGMRAGVVVAAGTGLIALGTGLDGSGWRRADGWGHLLGDCGSGAWIGRAGLEAALRAYDGRTGGSAALLARAQAVFGPAPTLPGRLYPRDDRAAVLASFAPEVARCAQDDLVAAGILRAASRHILEAAAAVRPDPQAGEVALTGGLFNVGEPLLGPLRAQAPQLLPGAELLAADGEPLHGALRIAAALSRDELPLPVDGTLLAVD